jgi:hypothetical protein
VSKQLGFSLFKVFLPSDRRTEARKDKPHSVLTSQFKFLFAIGRLRNPSLQYVSQNPVSSCCLKPLNPALPLSCLTHFLKMLIQDSQSYFPLN